MIKRIYLSLRCRSGASAAEYAIMIALITGAVVISAASLGSRVANVFKTFTPKIVLVP